ncbi:MAG: alpha/beta fold hydrolase [Spirochaetota bacterium]
MKIKSFGKAGSPRMIFLHGYGAHPHLYLNFITAAARRYEVLVPELFGLSGVCRRDFAENMNVLRDKIAHHELDGALVVGHSYGALAAMHLAAEYPQLWRAVAINPLLPQLVNAAKLRVQIGNMGRDFGRATGEMRGMLSNLAVGLRYGLNVLANPVGYVEGALRAISTELPHTSSAVPVDLVYADLDTLFHIEEADLGRWREVLPNLRLTAVPNYSHNWIIYHGAFGWQKIEELIS